MVALLVERISLLALLREQVLPAVIESRASSTEPLRIWSIGCQAGDEASTLALLVQSLLPTDFAKRAFTIFATDTDLATVSRARHYHYPAHLLTQLPQAALPLLEADSGTYRLRSSLRQQILFGTHALLSQMPFPHLDLILFHDTFANFTPVQQQVLFNRLTYALSPLGYLLLLSPAPGEPSSAYYQRLDAAWPLYQRTARSFAIHSSAWNRAEQQWNFPPVTQVAATEHDEVREVYMEELQASLEDREVAYQEMNMRLQELEQVFQDLEQMYLLKEDFLSMMSHEMRSPLTILLTTTQLLQKGMHMQQEGSGESGQTFQKRLEKDLQTIEQQGRRISRLLVDLLEAARMQNDMFHLSLHSTDLVKFVREIIWQQELVSARRISFVHTDDTIIGICDETRLEQVVRNLLINALKYSEPSSEVVVTLSQHFTADQTGEVLISIQDQGQGISKEDLPHIFDRFYRSAQPHHDPQGRDSLGLGLYISAEIVKRHGGRIWAESQLGEGSTFFVSLPLKEPATRLVPVAIDEVLELSPKMG